jgi:hypothetical protein
MAKPQNLEISGSHSGEDEDDSLHRPDDGGHMHLQNIGVFGDYKELLNHKRLSS